MKQTLINSVLLCTTLAFSVIFCIQNNEVENLRKELNRVENEVIEYEAKTQRLLDMNFILLSNSGWENFEE